MKYLFLIAGLLLSGCALSAPSFDCAKASTKIENLICENPELSEMDARMATDYRRFISAMNNEQRERAKKVQRLWLRNRDKSCRVVYELSDKSDLQCVKEAYSDWLDNISRGLLWADVALLQDVKEFRSPFGGVIANELKNRPSGRSDSREYRYTQSLNVGGTTLDGRADGYFGSISVNAEIYTHLSFIISDFGSEYTVARKLYRHSGGVGEDSYRETFTFLNPGKNINPSEITLREWSRITYTYERKFHDYGVTDDGNIFFVMDGDRGYINKVAVNPFGYLTYSKYVDKNQDAYLGRSYSSLYEMLKRHLSRINQKGSSLSSCALLGDFLQIYTDSFPHGNSHIEQILFSLRERVSLAWIRDSHVYSDQVDVFLDYLDRIRSVPDWQSRLTSLGEHEVYRGQRWQRVISSPDFYSPVADSGFPASDDCMSEVRSPVVGINLDEWVYLFWYRRLLKDEVDKTEEALRFIVSVMNAER